MNHLRPQQHLADLARGYPGIWRTVDELRAQRGKELPRWADWCFLPLAGAYAIASGGGNNRIPLTSMGEVPRIGALAAWRPSQGVYRFHEALLDAVWTTPLTGDLPVELFFRLPEWCVYIETPGRRVLNWGVHGFYAHLDEDMN